MVPSGKVASAWSSSIRVSTPSITSEVSSTSRPADMISATDMPSRAASSTQAVSTATASGWLSSSPRSRRRTRHLGRAGDHEPFLFVGGEQHPASVTRDVVGSGGPLAPVRCLPARWANDTSPRTPPRQPAGCPRCRVRSPSTRRGVTVRVSTTRASITPRRVTLSGGGRSHVRRDGRPRGPGMNVANDDLNDLVVAARSGDRAAFDELVRRTHADDLHVGAPPDPERGGRARRGAGVVPPCLPGAEALPRRRPVQRPGCTGSPPTARPPTSARAPGTATTSSTRSHEPIDLSPEARPGDDGRARPSSRPAPGRAGRAAPRGCGPSSCSATSTTCPTRPSRPSWASPSPRPRCDCTGPAASLRDLMFPDRSTRSTAVRCDEREPTSAVPRSAGGTVGS